MIRLYSAPLSGHCHRVRLAAGLMGIDIDVKPVSEMEGQRQGAEFLALNPFGEIPALDDDGFVIRDSIAIIIYLAKKYAGDGGWIPSSLEDRVRLQEWLAVAAGALYRGPNLARLIKLFNKVADYEGAVEASKKLFTIMDAHLDGRDWLVGDGPSLADIACYSYVRVADEGELDISDYANINRWLANIEALDGFVPVTRPG